MSKVAVTATCFLNGLLDMINDREFARLIVVCAATGGVCFKCARCRTCETARKYKVNKKFFEMMEGCYYRNAAGICTCSLEPCLRTDCVWMLKFAEMLV